MHRILQTTLTLLCAGLCATGAYAQKSNAKARSVDSPTTSSSYGNRPEAEVFVREVAERRHIDEAWLRASINQARFNATVQRLMTPRTGPAGVKNWRGYRGRFVEPIRIRAGLRFWNENAATLARAEQTYGVPAEYIVGIIGVETIYGQQMGNFTVVDSLATLAFDYPASHPRAADRAKYFRGELEQFLATAYLTGSNPFDTVGSYAGAMGMPQFMPTSWSNFAVDFDGDGKINLFGSFADAIGSVANYFVAHGWQRGMPAYYDVQVDSSPAQLETLLAPDIKPSFSAAEMAALGLRIQPPGNQHTGPLALIELQNASAATQYVVGTPNFYTITRYNLSSFYAMSVVELGQAIARARNGAPAASDSEPALPDPASETSNSPSAEAAAKAYLRSKARQQRTPDAGNFSAP
ncbi:lytic murein transglycosylase B [Comamonas piscis]|uniref:Lytic murein transglycosylase B n=1 Tax=Comamonas piscis TaxID=1562974 RepID=A0A7G5EG77_9BURK|nr:lytic murein transglycosylase B [Comamonas piscis]QMV73002.1 lytic murein transglycosylase B [Comamonas piscis]WSO35785.1 lytic murein transglycosylase B [Comamonas piscis]